MDALYAEAEQVYRKFRAEDSRLIRGGLLPDQPMMVLLGDKFAADYTADRQRQRDGGITGKGDLVIAYVEPAPGKVHDGSDVALKACVDGSGLSGIKDGKVVGTALSVEGYTYFKRVGESLRIVWADVAEVKSCRG